MTDYTIVNNVVVLDNARLDAYPLIKGKLDSMAADCGHIYNTCGMVYRRECPSSFTILRMASVLPLEAGADLDRQTAFIMGYMVAVLNYNLHVVELYDVCVTRNARERKGVIKSLLDAAKQIISEFTLWISIDLESESWDKMSREYVHAGFHSPVFYLNTPTGMLLSTKTVVGFIYNGEEADEEETLRVANSLRDYVKTECSASFHMSFNLAKHLFSYTLKGQEYTGSLSVISYHDGVARLGLDKDTVTKGEPPSYVVPITVSAVSFHTHPYLCNENYACYLTWPTITDMITVIKGYLVTKPPMYLHLVITIKGIYSLSLSVPFQKALTKMSPSEQEAIIQTIKDKLSGAPSDEGEKKPSGKADSGKDGGEGGEGGEGEEDDKDDFGDGDGEGGDDFGEAPPIKSTGEQLFYDVDDTEVEDKFASVVRTMSFENVTRVTRKNLSSGSVDDFPLFHLDFVSRDTFNESESVPITTTYFGKCPIEPKTVAEANLIR